MEWTRVVEIRLFFGLVVPLQDGCDISDYA
jgi:hypothetical protein